jgi:hypothetical protein
MREFLKIGSRLTNSRDARGFLSPVSILFQLGLCYHRFSWVVMGYHNIGNSLPGFVMAHLVTSYGNDLKYLITRRSLVQIQPPLFILCRMPNPIVGRSLVSIGKFRTFSPSMNSGLSANPTPAIIIQRFVRRGI